MSGAPEEPAPGEQLEREQQQSLQRIEAGDIPLAAERRLRELSQRSGAFTSDLTVGGFALCHQLGLRPLSQVMGSSIYQVGYQQMPWGGSLGGGFMFEMNALSDAWNEVRSRALHRLALEAGHVGADAVLGVELRTGAHDFAENAIEYVVLGTAVSHTDRRARGGRGPVLSELSVADYAKLAQAGIEPLGIVAWSAVFFVAPSFARQVLGGGAGFWQNQELSEFTQGIYAARETVIERMSAQARALDAGGVIGTRIDHSIRPTNLGAGGSQQSGMLVTFHAIGTAIEQAAGVGAFAPDTVIELSE